MDMDLIDKFIDYYWLTTGASKNTLSAYRSDLNIFYKWLEDKDIALVNSEHIQKYFKTRQKIWYWSLNSGKNIDMYASLLSLPTRK